MSMMRAGMDMAKLETQIREAVPGTTISVTEEEIKAYGHLLNTMAHVEPQQSAAGQAGLGGLSRATAAQIMQMQPRQRESDANRRAMQMLATPSPISDTPARPSPKIWGGTVELAEQRATYVAAGLEKHWLHNVYLERCKFVESLGYKAVTLPDLGEMLSGEKFNWAPGTVAGHSEYEVAQNHCWPSRPSFASIDKAIPKILMGTSGPLFRGRTKWRSGPLHDLVVPVPYGVVLLAKEVQEHRCSDYLEVFAPVSSFSEKPMMLPKDDPVLVGVVNNTPRDPAHATRFFLAKWGDDASPD